MVFGAGGCWGENLFVQLLAKERETRTRHEDTSTLNVSLKLCGVVLGFTVKELLSK